ncbi:hypothetical protein [Paraburkholderia sp. DGU8]|uniref:hypothetical protein n=1 Tax=Paraburkholderia sp. DGU8 TaxID=3161997 RepID=UPI003466DC0C
MFDVGPQIAPGSHALVGKQAGFAGFSWSSKGGAAGLLPDWPPPASGNCKAQLIRYTEQLKIAFQNLYK